MPEGEFTLTKEMVEAVAKIDLRLCTRCIGRLFAKVGTGLTNYIRGLLVVKETGLKPSEDCSLCKNIFEEVPKFAELAVEKLSGVEYNTFLIGTKVDESILNCEANLNLKTGTKWFESIKTELNREIGKLVAQKVKKKVDFCNPDVTILVDTRYDDASLLVKPLFIHGRYRKLKAGIPQTKWLCKRCFGKGCFHCGNKGKLYETSVQELIGEPALSLTGGEKHYFHGLGREDIDVLMLGDGRPFVLEISKPLKRSVDLQYLKNLINASAKGFVEVNGLRLADWSEVKRLKANACPKTYRVVVKFEQPVSVEKLKKLAHIVSGSEITQRTPTRVAHRRADRIRTKKVYMIMLDGIENDEATFEITVSAGTYVKELVTGDNGRTTPSFSTVLNMNCAVKSLEVLKVHNGEVSW